MSAGVTLAGNIKSILGVAESATIAITLNNYGNVIPTTSDGVLGNVQYIVPCNGSGAYSQALYGTYQITPAGTFYTITIKNAAGGYISQADYQLNTSGTFDIANLTPVTSYAGTPASTYKPSPPVTDILSSPSNPTTNGTRTVWTLSGPTISSVPEVYLNGIRQMLGVDFSYSGLTLTLFVAPTAGVLLQATYSL